MFTGEKLQYTVSQLSSLIKETLESGFYSLTVEGELINFKPSSTGHWYFSLKDDKSSIKAVMFKQKQSSVSVKLQDGMKVSVKGSLSVYTPRGEYQIIVDKIESSGEGDLLVLLEKRKQMFLQEGLFDPARKKELPAFPSCVGVITSPTGAALKDIMRVLSRRNAGLHIRIFPAVVQGESAAAEIARMISLADIIGGCDVLIVGRGGGSMEDLLPFSDESVVRAIAACSIPVISAVGHEIDTPLSDWAADVRAPTPSAAAELVCSSREEIQARLESAYQMIQHRMQAEITRAKTLLRSFEPEELKERFYHFFHPVQQKLDDLKEDLLLNVKNNLQIVLSRIHVLKAGIEASDPDLMQQKGWAYITDETGEKIKVSANEMKENENILIHLKDGAALARILERKK